MDAHSLTHDTSVACKNCGASASGNYCQQCGQAVHLHVPSAREFLHEFIAHYVALEGKLWKTLAQLIARPGFLTREYIEGRRARYLEPLRLYLTFSIIFFAVFKLGGVDMSKLDGVSSPAAVAAIEARTADTTLGMATPEHAAEFGRFQGKAVAWVKGTDSFLGEKVEQFFALPPHSQRDALKRAFFSYTPYAIFAMMPIFALYLKLLYLGSGRHYGEHFLFALHSNAFAFLLLSVLLLLPRSWEFMRFVLMCWLLFYLPFAMRRVYGGGIVATGARWIVLIHAHMLSIVAAVLAAMGQALLG